ncbi:hypothetical protein QN277_027754 [Acacia crassicarpa]|uniref:DUF4283 domain-containing protein n=1 Tax=Acacia crassicarpa TaxID=499986 RepID=A0AAE1J1Q1_9FABA|nr:hypothetical protein QN277_027754 [Acacia crassicarpa]
MGFAVTVKLLGRTIGLRQLQTQLQNLWKPSGKIEVTDLDEDRFLIQLKIDMDFKLSLAGGPWLIYGHYLTVQPWTPVFKPQTHVINQVVGWVRLPRLPACYYHRNIIRSIESVSGEVIRVDYNMESGDRSKFDRLAVLNDLTKPLTSKIQVDGDLIYMEYEGLPTICVHCGRYGHLNEAFPVKKMNLAEAQIAQQQTEVELAKPPSEDSREASQYGA